MNILIVYSHPYNGSFNHAIKDELITALQAAGHTTELRDLYALHFNPVLSEAELLALKHGNVYADVKIEQEYVSWADLIIFIYPLWWCGMPAITRGYLDRIFSCGYAYQNTIDGPIGLLDKKKIVLINTVGESETAYTANGMFNALELLADVGVFRFCDAQVIKHIHLPGIPTTTLEQRQVMLAELSKLSFLER